MKSAPIYHLPFYNRTFIKLQKGLKRLEKKTSNVNYCSNCLQISNSVSLRATFGWARIEVLGALFNIIFTLALSFSIFVEGILNLIHSSHHKSETNKPWTLIIPGIISLIMNLCRALFFTGKYCDSLSILQSN